MKGDERSTTKQTGNGGGEIRQRTCVQVRLPGTYLGPNSRRGAPGLAGRPAVTWRPVCGSKLVQPWHWQEPGWLRSQPALAEHLCRTGFGENRHTCLPRYVKPAETAPDLVTEYCQSSERAKECLVIQFHLGLCLKKKKNRITAVNSLPMVCDSDSYEFRGLCSQGMAASIHKYRLHGE